MDAGEEFIINFTNDIAFLSDTLSLQLTQLNLPAFAQTFKTDAHWLCRVIRYNPIEKKIFAQILEYHLGHEPFYSWQDALGDDFEIERISFRAIDTNKLLITLGGITKVESFISTPIPEDEAYDFFTFDSLTDPDLIHGSSANLTDEPVAHNPTYKIINSEIKVAWKDIHFDYGYCTVDYKVRTIDQTIQVRIYNQSLRPEFDAIKNYFGKKLGCKKAVVKLKLKFEGIRLLESHATSAEIEQINPSIIESVKFELLKDLPKKKFIDPIDKSLFTMDEYFESLKDETAGLGAFYDKESALVDDLLSITSTKHYKHLRYLSDRHAAQIMKLRFILKPFSFVFLIEGGHAYHIIWETLDTAEATYVWHTEKNLRDLKGRLQHVDGIIQAIQIQGKLTYLQAGESNYKRIFHDYSKLVDGFIKWKGELENILY